MTKVMRLRITGGPSVLSIRVEDIETGKLLPVTALTFYRDEQYHVAARVTLLIHEVDINFEGEVEVAEEIQPIRPEWAEGIRKLNGTIVRDPRGAASS
jgi:hypothetical protein